jgi:protein tyrosine phosphatase (PTP) superfamily phosphohydrolase (DUF442 family)
VGITLTEEGSVIDWSVTRVLARARRPGYPHTNVSRVEVEEWVREARSLGVTTVICLLSDSELGIYAAALAVVGGLFGFYRSRGLEVRHIPVDPASDPPITEAQLAEVVEAFNQADKPVVLHASADGARTEAAVKQLKDLLGGC